jgi:alanyl-tRNA synthetase
MVLVDIMGNPYQELINQKELIFKVVKEEEQSFFRTLELGIKRIDDLITQLKSKNTNIISGVAVFELYDTYGFPVDLTSLIARENGLHIDEDGFHKELQIQKDRSRAATSVETDDWVQVNPDIATEFIGYDQTYSEVEIIKYRKVSQKGKEFYQLVLNQTPFYPEGGGQIGDKGSLKKNESIISIFDTKKENNLIIHLTDKLPINLTGTFEAQVNTTKREQTSNNHSATHLLHHALRKVLGKHVEQKGSLVNPNYLRFDFSHFSKVTDEEIKRVEDFVNQRIQEQLPLIERRNIPIQQALEEGAMALFGEKYGDNVRAIKFGESMELCGGIHVENTANIWQFKIISEGAVAGGIRRIEAITGDAVKSHFAKQENTLSEIKEALKNPQDTIKAVLSLQDENTKLKKQVEQLLKDKARGLKTELAAQIIEVNGVKFLSTEVDLDANGAKDLAYELGQNQTNLFLVFGTISEDKPMLTCSISKELVSDRNLNAGQVVRELGKYIQGGGGGQAFFATAGGKNAAGMKEALAKAIDFIK